MNRPPSSSRISRTLVATLLLAVMTLPGCYYHHIRVGMGGNGVSEKYRTQYYILFGLFRLNSVDVQQEVADINSYDVTTSFSGGDLLLLPLLLPLTVTSRTVVIQE